jgi:hypothetical protein
MPWGTRILPSGAFSTFPAHTFSLEVEKKREK